MTDSNLLSSSYEINKTETLDNTLSDFVLVNSIEVSNENKKELSGNIDVVVKDSIDFLGISDEWSRNTEKIQDKSLIDKVTIEDLYNPDKNVVYDTKNKQLSFKDSTILQTDSKGCVILNSDTISLSKLTNDIDLLQFFDKINNFGKLYDFQIKNVNFGQYEKGNSSVCAAVSNALGYVSFDKLINDEIIRKKKIIADHIRCPEKFPDYDGFLISDDYLNGGWINVDQLIINDDNTIDEEKSLSIRTRKIKDAKRIVIKLFLNYYSSIFELGSEAKYSDFGVRIKNITTGEVFDRQNVRNGNPNGISNQVVLSHSGKFDYGVSSQSPSISCNPFERIITNKCTGEILKVTDCKQNELVEGIIHDISPQVSLNPSKDANFVNTIDSIKWTTGIQNINDYENVFKDLIEEWGIDEYKVDKLNVQRSFHYAAGDGNTGYVCGGFFHNVLNDNHSDNLGGLQNINGWCLVGNSKTYYEISTPGGYSYNSTNLVTLYFEEVWDGNTWSVIPNNVVPVPKAMGIAGGGISGDNNIIGFGIYDADFSNNGVVNKLYPCSQVWYKTSDVWTLLNYGNYTRASPSGYLKSTGENHVGIAFNGWIGNNTNNLGLGSSSNNNIDPWGLDKIKNSDLTNIFEYMETSGGSASWFVDTLRNYPIKTMGTLYLGDENRGIATGGKTGSSLSEFELVNTIKNIKYSYFNDSKYNEFDNSIVNAVYEYNGKAWIRRDNMLESVAFHTGVGNAEKMLVYGGLHGSVEKSDIVIAYPGCDEWEIMIKNFGGVWNRFGSTGLDREKRYASFATIKKDDYGNVYYKVGDKRDSSYVGTTDSSINISGNNWSTYTNSLSGHVTRIAYANRNSEFSNNLDLIYYTSGESRIVPVIKLEKLNNNNPLLPYAEREPALDGIDQVGSITKNIISEETYKYSDTYKPDYWANSSNSTGSSAFPSGYFAVKDNYLNVVNQYKYSGHNTNGGMWLWSRPTAGEELFHPTNIFEHPSTYIDSCGVEQLSGNWQSYESWVNQSFNTKVGLHSAICWVSNKDCLTEQDTDAEKALGYATETSTNRFYRWTMGDFRNTTNRLSPGGKVLSCLDVDVVSDRELLYNLGYINFCSYTSGISAYDFSTGAGVAYSYAYEVKNGFRVVSICSQNGKYRGFVETNDSIQELPLTGYVVDVPTALSIAPSANWDLYFDYVIFQDIQSASELLKGVYFNNGAITENGLNSPILVSNSSDYFSNNLTYPGTFTVNVSADLVGYANECYSPIDYFNRIWFIPTVPISSNSCSGSFTCPSSSSVFYNTAWFDSQLTSITGCTNPDGLFLYGNQISCDNSCTTWWTSGCNIVTIPGNGFYWINGYSAPYLSNSFYDNSFNTTGCNVSGCYIDTSTYWNFTLPESNNLIRINNLRHFYDILSFGLPADYIIPAKLTYSFYITRDGVGLDQLFYGRKKNTFIERWKFPHSDVIKNVCGVNNKSPYFVNNNRYESLLDSSLFDYGTLSVGEILTNISYDNKVSKQDIYDSIVRMSLVQADICSSKMANYYVSSVNTSGEVVSCNFTSLYNWIFTDPIEGVKEKYISNYYPMTYDNFSGNVSGSYFLPRGKIHQSQFSIIPTANSSSIRDRAALWPWCDLLEGKSTNKPKLGSTTWNWDSQSNLWVAEVVSLENVVMKYCYDQNTNNDPLHRKLSTDVISKWYPENVEREIYRIRGYDINGNNFIDYKITYDTAAGPEIIGSKEGFDYNIFGVGLLPRSIDLSSFNNVPLNGPTQTWIGSTDESECVFSKDWKRTQIKGLSGCPVDLYQYNYGTVCQMLSGGINKNNIGTEGVGYFCKIESEKDTWIYSVPLLDIPNTISEKFFIQESPFSLINVMVNDSQGEVLTSLPYVSGGLCLIDGFPPLVPICYTAVPATSSCCYVLNITGGCFSTDIAFANFTYAPNVSNLLVVPTSGSLSITGACASSFIISPANLPLTGIGFFGFGQTPTSYPYQVLGWYDSSQYAGYGSEIVQTKKYSDNSSLISSGYITGPSSYGLGGLGFGKSNGLCGKLLYSGSKVSCKYSVTTDEQLPSDLQLQKAWPWNIIGFTGILGPKGYTDAVDDSGNYWIAIGDINNTNPYDLNGDFQNISFKNNYTIIKVANDKKTDFFKTILAKTNYDEVNASAVATLLCLSQKFNLFDEDVRGVRYREAILETLNMPEGQRYYDFYIKLVLENNNDVSSNAVLNSKVNGIVSGSYILPVEPVSTEPAVTNIQIVDIVSKFDPNCVACYICPEVTTDSISASKWVQHNHDEWVTPFLDSPFSGPYAQPGFNIWLTNGENNKWGVSLWSTTVGNKVWANYRRQKLHVNTYRNHLVLSTITAAVSIDDFEEVYLSSVPESISASGTIPQIPVYFNYDEFIYNLNDYKDTIFVNDMIANQTNISKNGVDCTDNFVINVSNNFTLSITGNLDPLNNINCYYNTVPCSGYDISIFKDKNEGYVEWVTSFIQEYASPTNGCASNKDLFFRYDSKSKMQSNTYMNPICFSIYPIIPYQWKKHQDGIGMGGNVPGFNINDDNVDYTCNKLNKWFIGQSAFGSIEKAIVVGGYAIAEDGELHRSKCWWESPTFGTTFKWNVNIIQPEDTYNLNYLNRNLSPFWSNGENTGTESSMSVLVMDVGGGVKIERQGIAKFEENTKEYNVVFDEPIPSYLPNKDKYSVSMVCNDNIKLWWENKTENGFTIKCEIAFSGFVDWSVYLEDNVPSDVIDSLDEDTTYDNFKNL